MNDSTIVVRPDASAKLLEHKLLEGLSDIERLFVKKHSQEISLRKHDLLFKENDKRQFLYIIHEGIVKEYIRASKRVIIRQIYYPVDIICENVTRSMAMHDSIAIALAGPVKILAIDLNCLKTLSKQNHHVASYLIDFFANQSAQRSERIDRLMRDDAKSRIVHFITSYATTYGVKIGMHELLFKHNFTQQDIADYTATSRQTVVTVLNELKDEKSISFMRNRILIKDMDSLKLQLVS